MYNIKCPNCGAEQKGLCLEETNGTFICSECQAQIKVDLNELIKVNKDESKGGR